MVIDDLKEKFIARSPTNGKRLYSVIIQWLLLQLKQEYVSYLFISHIKMDTVKGETILKNDVLVDLLSQDIDFVLNEAPYDLVEDLKMYIYIIIIY